MAEIMAAGASCRLRTLRGRDGRLRIWLLIRSKRASVSEGMETLRKLVGANPNSGGEAATVIGSA